MRPHLEASLHRRLIFSLVLTTFIFLAELAGGIWTGSLALISDAAHVFLDVFALGISYIAIRISSRPADLHHTYGFHRFEILAALVNGITLVIIAVWIFYEAIIRIFQPEVVKSTPMLIIATIGLVANLVVAFVLRKNQDNGKDHHQVDLNLHSAYLHVLGDAISSIGVIIAAILISLTGLFWLDPAMSILIGIIILSGAYRVTRNSIHILLEGTPKHLDLTAIQTSILSIANITEIHDLHIWNICSGHVALSVHLITQVDTVAERENVLYQVSQLMLENYAIEHTTIQLEKTPCNSISC